MQEPWRSLRAYPTNDIQNVVTAAVTTGVVTAPAASITAGESGRISSVSAGLAGATYLTITGGVGNNNIDSTVDAHVSSGQRHDYDLGRHHDSGDRTIQ